MAPSSGAGGGAGGGPPAVDPRPLLATDRVPASNDATGAARARGKGTKKNLNLEVPISAVYMVMLTVFMDTLAASISTPILPYYAAEFADNYTEISAGPDSARPRSLSEQSIEQAPVSSTPQETAALSSCSPPAGVPGFAFRPVALYGHTPATFMPDRAGNPNHPREEIQISSRLLEAEPAPHLPKRPEVRAPDADSTAVLVGYLFASWSLASAIFPPMLGRLADRKGRSFVLRLSLFGASSAAFVQGLAGVLLQEVDDPDGWAGMWRRWADFWRGDDDGLDGGPDSDAQRVLLAAGAADRNAGSGFHIPPKLLPLVLLFAGRFFSGVWAAIGSTVQVYLTDIAKDDKTRQDLLAWVGSAPPAALMFGPALGGSLATYALNLPLFFDCIVTVFAALLVGWYLPESPAWLREQGRRASVRSVSNGGGVETAEEAESKKAKDAKERDVEGERKPNQPTPDTTSPEETARILRFLQLDAFCRGLDMSGRVSMFAIFARAKYDFDTIDIGFCFMATAVLMILNNVWFVGAVRGLVLGFVKRRFFGGAADISDEEVLEKAAAPAGGFLLMSVAALLQTVGYAGMVLTPTGVEEDGTMVGMSMDDAGTSGTVDSQHHHKHHKKSFITVNHICCLASLAFYFFGSIASSWRMSTAPGVLGRYTSPKTRGATFAKVLVYANTGRIFGPIILGHLAAYAPHGPLVYPWLFLAALHVIGCAISLNGFLFVTRLGRAQAQEAMAEREAAEIAEAVAKRKVVADRDASFHATAAHAFERIEQNRRHELQRLQHILATSQMSMGQVTTDGGVGAVVPLGADPLDALDPRAPVPLDIRAGMWLCGLLRELKFLGGGKFENRIVDPEHDFAINTDADLVRIQELVEFALLLGGNPDEMPEPGAVPQQHADHGPGHAVNVSLKRLVSAVGALQGRIELMKTPGLSDARDDGQPDRPRFRRGNSSLSIMDCAEDQEVAPAYSE